MPNVHPATAYKILAGAQWAQFQAGRVFHRARSISPTAISTFPPPGCCMAHPLSTSPSCFRSKASYLSPEGERFDTAVNHVPRPPHHPHQYRRRRNHPEHLDVHAVRHRQAARGGRGLAGIRRQPFILRVDRRHSGGLCRARGFPAQDTQTAFLSRSAWHCDLAAFRRGDGGGLDARLIPPLSPFGREFASPLSPTCITG
jgi:hypothetical protein